MRVALCLSGQPRLENGCLEHQFNFLHGVADIDVFAHIWNGFPEGNDRFVEELKKRLAPRGTVVKVAFSDCYQWERPMNFSYYPENAWAEFNRRPVNTIIMYNGVARADQLRRDHEFRNDFRYDLVIRSRSDITFDQPVHLRRLLGAARDYVVTPRNGHYREGYCDQFAVSSSVNMTIYSGLFGKIETYLTEGLPLHSETLLRRHLTAADLPILSGFFQTIIFRQGVPYIGTTPVKFQV
jgi:hypothetical protein